MYLGRLVRTVVEHAKSVHNYGEWYREHSEQPDPVVPVAKKASIKLAPVQDKFSPGKLVAQDLNNSQCHTPSSILKVDHGYVPASGASLVDFDDTYNTRSRANKLQHTQVIIIVSSCNIYQDLTERYYLIVIRF